jgi:hypothetical protein
MPVTYRSRSSRSPGRHAPAPSLLSLRPAVGHAVLTVPWTTVLSACIAGLAISVISSQLLNPLRSTPGTLIVSHIAAIPLAGAAAFLAFSPDKNLMTTLPAPSWLPLAIRLASALPVIVLTAVIQYELVNVELTAGAKAAPAQAPWPAQFGEFVAWLAIATATAAAVDRTRWRELGGAAAAPVAFALIGVLAATALRSGWECWAVALAAGVGSVWASRDPWLRLRLRTFPPYGQSPSRCPHHAEN